MIQTYLLSYITIKCIYENILSILNNLKPSLASGPDGLNAFVLKNN